MTRTVSHPLFVAVAVAAFVAWALLPTEPPELRQGRVLVFMDLQGVGPGETHQRDFRVDDFYTSMELSYNITQAAHVRAALVDPDGTRHESEVHPERDEITLAVPEPERGDWRFEVRTLEDPDMRGHIVSGNFTILGFGGTLQLV